MNNEILADLKAKAENAAIARSGNPWYSADDGCWWTGNVDEGDFIAAANPAVVLALIDENEDLVMALQMAEERAENAGRNSSSFEDAMGNLQVENGRLRDQVDHLKSQFSELHAALNLLSRLSSAGFPLGDDAAESILSLRVENERLTKIIGTQVIRKFVGQDDQREIDELVALGIEQDKREIGRLRSLLAEVPKAFSQAIHWEDMLPIVKRIEAELGDTK